MRILKLDRSQLELALIIVTIFVNITASAVGMDIYLPSFPNMMEFFQVSESELMLIMSSNFVGLCFASLLWGPLAEGFGRKRVLIVGLSIFFVSSVGCCLVNELDPMLFYRFWQGFGASSSFVVCGAIVFDIFNKEKAMKFTGNINFFITLAISMSPIIGGILNRKFGWQANFILIAIFAAISLLCTIFFFKETLSPEKRTDMNIKQILKNYGRLLTFRMSLVNLLILCISYALYMAITTNFPLLAKTYLGVDEILYDYYQWAVLFCYALASVFFNKLSKSFGFYTITTASFLICLISSVAMVLVALLYPSSAFYYTIAISLFNVGFAFLVIAISANFMDVFPEIKATSASLGTSSRMLAAALGVYLMGLVFDGTMLSVALFSTVLVVLVTILYFFIKNYYRPNRE